MPKTKPTYSTHVTRRGKTYKADLFIDHELLAKTMSRRAVDSPKLFSTIAFGAIELQLTKLEPSDA